MKTRVLFFPLSQNYLLVEQIIKFTIDKIVLQ